MSYIKNRFLSEVEKYKADTNWFDRIFVWVVRAMLLYSIINIKAERIIPLVCLHFCGTFAIDFLHLLTPQKSFFNKISYSINTHASFMLLIGSFFGHFISLYNYIPKYDWVMHTFAGILSVYIGYYVIKPLLTPKTKAHNQIVTLFSFCFANFGIVAWEVMEFVSDYIIGSNNQRFDYVPDTDIWLFKLIGMGNTTPAHYPMFDTMFDTCFALIGAIGATTALYIMLARRIKSKKLTEKELEQEPELVEVS